MWRSGAAGFSGAGARRDLLDTAAKGRRNGGLGWKGAGVVRVSGQWIAEARARMRTRGQGGRWTTAPDLEEELGALERVPARLFNARADALEVHLLADLNLLVVEGRASGVQDAQRRLCDL